MVSHMVVSDHHHHHHPLLHHHHSISLHFNWSHQSDTRLSLHPWVRGKNMLYIRELGWEREWCPFEEGSIYHKLWSRPVRSGKLRPACLLRPAPLLARQTDNTGCFLLVLRHHHELGPPNGCLSNALAQHLIEAKSHRLGVKCWQSGFPWNEKTWNPKLVPLSKNLGWTFNWSAVDP